MPSFVRKFIERRQSALAKDRLSPEPMKLAQFNKNLDTNENFALLSYSTQNLGDEIQSLAAQSFLPHVATLADRDRLSSYQLEKPHKIILNGWFSHSPRHWPPSSSLVPLITSIHASGTVVKSRNPDGNSFASRVQDQDSVAFMQAHGPIGARDRDTFDLLTKLGVPSYFSGCLTLTLTCEEPPRRQRYVCVNDLDADVSKHVRDASGMQVVRTTHLNSRCTDPAKRMQLAQDLLTLYASAQFVITSRLHCALPCLALGTPVLFCPMATDTKRFSGLSNLVRTTSRDRLLSGHSGFDFRGPAQNSTDFIALREDLMRRCQDFVHRGAR